MECGIRTSTIIGCKCRYSREVFQLVEILNDRVVPKRRSDGAAIPSELHSIQILLWFRLMN